MAQLQELLETQRNMEASLSLRMDAYEKSLAATATRDNQPSLEELALDFKSFREMAWSLLQSMRSQIQNILLQVDDIDTYNRRNALLFGGIPETENEDCTVAILSVINSTMNLGDIESNTIQLCHRLGPKKTTGCRPILVRFSNIQVRNHIWTEKKRLKSTPTVVSEFLTKSRQAIFSSARSHFGIRGCWTRDGAVFVKLPNNDRKRVVTVEELDALMKKYPAATKTNSPSRATGTSLQPLQAGTSAAPASASSYGRLPPPTSQPPATRSKATSRKANK